MALLVAAIVIGLLIGLALTRDTSTDVPNVTNKQLEFAIAQLERKGFTVGSEEFVQRETQPNVVLEQDPLPGSADAVAWPKKTAPSSPSSARSRRWT